MKMKIGINFGALILGGLVLSTISDAIKAKNEAKVKIVEIENSNTKRTNAQTKKETK